MTRETRPDYGLDAPGVVRNLLLGGGVGLALWIAGISGLWSGEWVLGPIGGVTLRFPLTRMGLWAGAGMTAMAGWMIWSSRVGKLRERERFLDRLSWTGNERVLDVGCGRGLMLIGAARRLTAGRAVGIDLWQAQDLSGNRPGAVFENARREGVAGRVAVSTADMRDLPFPSAAFDAVVSCAAIHNIPSPTDRARALVEIARVLKPGGRIAIDDIRHGGEYAKVLAATGCEDVRRVGSRAGALLLALVTMGSLHPDVLMARKRAADTAPAPAPAPN
jgi:SAM-dependent methyltransferase